MVNIFQKKLLLGFTMCPPPPPQFFRACYGIVRRKVCVNKIIAFSGGERGGGGGGGLGRQFRATDVFLLHQEGRSYIFGPGRQYPLLRH